MSRLVSLPAIRTLSEAPAVTLSQLHCHLPLQKVTTQRFRRLIRFGLFVSHSATKSDTLVRSTGFLPSVESTRARRTGCRKQCRYPVGLVPLVGVESDMVAAELQQTPVGRGQGLTTLPFDQ